MKASNGQNIGGMLGLIRYKWSSDPLDILLERDGPIQSRLSFPYFLSWLHFVCCIKLNFPKICLSVFLFFLDNFSEAIIKTWRKGKKDCVESSDNTCKLACRC